MQRRISPAGAIIVFFSLILLNSCKNQNIDRAGLFPFDTARASGSVIPISEAILLQKNFLTTRDSLRLQKGFTIYNAESFTRDALLLLLTQKGADGIRIYYGKDNAGVVRLVLLPYSKDGKDIINKLITTNRNNTDSTTSGRSKNSRTSGDGEAVETGQTCPPCMIVNN